MTLKFSWEVWLVPCIRGFIYFAVSVPTNSRSFRYFSCNVTGKNYERIRDKLYFEQSGGFSFFLLLHTWWMIFIIDSKSNLLRVSLLLILASSKFKYDLALRDECGTFYLSSSSSCLLAYHRNCVYTIRGFCDRKLVEKLNIFRG